jgi:hypothetical protein
MNDGLRTVNAETRQTYWARRLLVLGAMMLLAISVVLIIHGTSSGGEVEAHPSSAPTDGTDQLGPVVCATDEPPTQSATNGPPTQNATEEPPSQIPTPAPSKTKKTPEAVFALLPGETLAPNPLGCPTDEVPPPPTVPDK